MVKTVLLFGFDLVQIQRRLPPLSLIALPMLLHAFPNFPERLSVTNDGDPTVL
jgi:hypothetical protein